MSRECFKLQELLWHKQNCCWLLFGCWGAIYGEGLPQEVKGHTRGVPRSIREWIVYRGWGGQWGTIHKKMYLLQKYLLQECSPKMVNQHAVEGVHWCRPSCWLHTLKTHENCPCNRILKNTNKLGMFSVSVIFQVSDSGIPITAFIFLILLLLLLFG